MPSKNTVRRAKEDLRAGKKPSTAAGEFVREEVEHVREGKHGARSSKQAIAIGLSKARRAGVPLPPPKKGATSERTRRSAARDIEVGKGARKRAPSRRRSAASKRALEREGSGAASRRALSAQAKSAARRRSGKRATRRKTTGARRTSAGARRRGR